MRLLLLNLILSILVVFFTEGIRTRCFKCYKGRDSYDINQNFSLLECENFNNKTDKDYGTCEDGCMKLQFGIGLGSSMTMANIYTCQDRDIDVKMKNKAEILTHVACYTDFCNSEIDWKIPKLKEAFDTKGSHNISPIFWICLSIAILAVVCCKINGICMDTQNVRTNNMTIADSSGDEQ